ncbi:MAG: spore cortex biosynthesis protein YabQ [Clostridia bacterium]|nr:spore cortex biosynthesis protein YabQ [Clostridia bacterium]
MNNEYFLHMALAMWSVILGAFLCAVYDVFRLLRQIRRQNVIFVFIGDFLFCIFSAVCLLILFFNLSYGRVRFYALVLAIVGFMVWRFTVSRLVMTLLLKLIRRIKKFLTSIKMRVDARFLRLMRRIYTKRYCRNAVRNVHPKGLLK